MSKRTRKAFTLVEIVIAAVLASLVTLSAVAAVRIVTRGREKIERYSQINSELRYVAESMKQDLGNMYRATEGRKFVGQMLATDVGQVPSLTFYATRQAATRKGEPEGDVYEVQYTVGTRNGKAVMLRRVWPNPSDQLEPSGVVSVLSENITGFDIRYLDDKEWRADWPEDMGKDCSVMMVNIAAAVPGESKTMVKSFLIDFPRRAAMASAAGSTGTSTTAVPATTSGAARGSTATGSTGGTSVVSEMRSSGSGRERRAGGQEGQGGTGSRDNRGNRRPDDGDRRPPERQDGAGGSGSDNRPSDERSENR